MKLFFAEREDWPRPLGPVLDVADLRAADVLLSRGEGDISDCIVSADGGSYSHAALWTGATVVEAVEDGVVEGRSVHGRDVYRWSDPGGLPAPVAAGIVHHAHGLLGRCYSNSELFLLAGLFAMGLSPRRSLMHRALDALGDQAGRLEAWLAELGPACTPVICTELVAQAYYAAAEDRPYALKVLPPSQRGQSRPSGTRQHPFGSAHAQDAAVVELTAHCRRILHRVGREAPASASPRATAPANRKLLWGSLALDSVTGARVGVVTPADLQFSPSLQFLGRVELTTS